MVTFNFLKKGICLGKTLLKSASGQFLILLSSWLFTNQVSGFSMHGRSTQPPVRFEHIIDMFILALVVHLIVTLLKFNEKESNHLSLHELFSKLLSATTILSLIFISWWFYRIPISNSFIKSYLIFYASWVALSLILRWKLEGAHFTYARGFKNFILNFFKEKFNFFSSLLLIFLFLIGCQIKIFPNSSRTSSIKKALKKTRQIWFREETNWKLEEVYPIGTYWEPMDISFIPEQKDNYLLLDRRGRIWKHSLKGQNQPPELILDCSSLLGNKSRVDSDWGASNDGALSLAIHPRFGYDGESRIFIYLSFPDTKNQNQCTLLVSFVFNQLTPEKRFNSIEKIIFTEDSKKEIVTAFHSGGGLAFGNDGFLYLGKGDLGEPNNAYKIDQKHVGVIRIDIDRKGGAISSKIKRQPTNGITKGYYIPNDNPFVGRKDILHEHFSIGLRNPFRISYDSINNEFWVGNVGQNNFEEIEILKSGSNHQWPWKEGPDKFPSYNELEIGTLIDPIFYYPHNSIDRSVVIGPVYRGTKYNYLYNKVLYADTISGKIRALNKNEKGKWISQPLAQAPAMGSYGIVKIISHSDGEIYFLAKGESKTASGTIYRLVPGKIDMSTSNNYSSEQRFQQLCSVCHGADGKGQKTFSSQIEKPMPDFTSQLWQKEKSDEWIRNVIKNGGASMNLDASMPPWREVLTKNEIDDMVKYIRSMSEYK